MRVLYVSGDDYCVLDFEEHVRENKLTFEQSSKIKRLFDSDNYEVTVEIEEKEFGDICPNFVKFIKNEVVDSDSSKHSNFYTEEDELFKHK